MLCLTLTTDNHGKDRILPFIRVQDELVLSALREDMRNIYQLLKKEHGVPHLEITRASIEKGEVVPFDGHFSGELLLHVELSHEGELYWGSTIPRFQVVEYKKRRRVQKTFLLFEEGVVGVQTLAKGKGPHGEERGLVRMLPGAVFRINRDSITVPSMLDVEWDGKFLRRLEPRESREMRKKVEA